jgi:hypothetical protein
VLSVVFWLCSEEKIEFAGALGKADVSNRMLDDIERDLEDLWAAGQLDSFCLYVYGLVLADRCVPLNLCGLRIQSLVPFVSVFRYFQGCNTRLTLSPILGS